MKQTLRRTGIEVIGNAPWGTHFCQFYKTRQDLLEILVPYFRQGLADNEFCMWVTSEPVGVEEAKAALAAVEPGLDDFIRQGRIEFLDYRQWYTRGGSFDAERVLQGWVDRLESARARGLEGLRLTGNTFWLERKDWAGFTAYEEAVNRVIGEYRMLALCTYSLERCAALEIMDVLANHRFALVKREGRWQTIESSESRRAEAALAESEQKYSEVDRAARQLSQFPLQNPNPVLRVAADGTLLFANEPARKWLAALGWQTPGPLPAELLAVAEQARAADHPVETEVVCPAGRAYFLTAARPPHEDYVSCYAIDITQRKEAEVALQRNEALLRSVLEQMPSGVTVREAGSGKLLLSNSRSEEILGSLAGSQGEFSRYGGLHRDSRPYRIEDWPLSRSMAKGEVVQAEEIDCERSDGARITLSVSSAPIRDPDGRITAVVGIFHDLTERRRIERQYSTLFDATSDGVWIHDLSGEILEVNDAYCRMSGYSRDELRHMPVSRLEAAESPQQTATHLRKLIEGGGHDRFESRHRRKDGSLFDVEITALYFDQVLGRIAIFTRDITRRKQAEEALRQSREDLNRAQEVGQIGSWRLDVRSDVLSWSDEAYRIFGVPKGTPQTYETFLGRVHPDDRQRVDAEWKAALAGRPYDIEHRVLAGGEVKWVREKAFLEFDSAGELLGGFGITQDITERKRIEEELERLAQQRQLALDAANLGWWRYDPAARIASWDEGVRKIFDVADYQRSLEEFQSLVHPADLPDVWARVEEALNPLQARPFYAEYRLRLPDGSAKWVEAHGLASFEGEGQGRRAVSLVGTIADITARKQAEQALNESYAELDRFNRAMVGREARMIELKQQVNELRLKAGQPPLYRLDFEK